MAYNSNIPQPTDIPANSQSQILGNFVALKAFGNGYCDLPVQATQPPTLPLTSVTDTALYNFSYTATGSSVANNETFIQTQVNGGASQKQIPMTASTLSNTVPTSGLSGWTYLPSGILMKWGKVPVTMSLIYVTINMDSVSGGPAFINVFNMQVTAFNSSAAITTGAVLASGPSGTSARVYMNTGNANTGVYYFAIGN
jgi:hypothetical protein